MVGTRHILGLAIDDSGIVATELCIRSGRAEIRRSGELPWEQELTADNATQLGQQLRQFLRDQGFSARRAVVGLAAKWVLAKEVDAPPASADALAGMLSIQAERVFSLDADDLIFDYCGRTSATENSQVLLVAARRQIVDQIRELARAAGLKIQAVTISALACGKAMYQTPPACHYGLYARPTYCEFWTQSDGNPRLIKYVPMAKDGSPAGYTDLLSSALERLVLLSSGQGQTPPYQVMAYDACGLPDAVVDRLNERLGPQITVRNGCAELLSKGFGLADRPEGAHAIAAAAVAMTAVGTDRPPVDFLNPRIGLKRTSSRKRVVFWTAFVAVAGLVALGAVLADWHGDRRDIAIYSEQLKQMSADIVAAQEVVDRISYAGSWASQEPCFLNCLRELTLAFPEEPRVWVTSLALNENGTGSLVGKATSEASFYEVVDAIRQNKMFSDVKMIHIRDAGRDSKEKEFAVSFKFQGAK
jgi:hypothetical protein